MAKGRRQWKKRGTRKKAAGASIGEANETYTLKKTGAEKPFISARIYFDGSSTNNGRSDSRAGCGAHVIGSDGRVGKEARFVGVGKTNNEAEYAGAILGLETARDMGYKEVALFGDSQLVVRQMGGRYETRHERMKIMRDRFISAMEKFDRVSLTYIPRDGNKEADALARRGANSEGKSLGFD